MHMHIYKHVSIIHIHIIKFIMFIIYLYIITIFCISWPLLNIIILLFSGGHSGSLNYGLRIFICMLNCILWWYIAIGQMHSYYDN